MNAKSPVDLPRCAECGRRVRPGEVVGFRADAGVKHATCPRRGLLLPVGAPLSETAEALLSFLRSIPESAACENCAAAYLQVDRHGALKAIRELILNGRILCAEASCSVCRDDRVVARLRRERTSA